MSEDSEKLDVNERKSTGKSSGKSISHLPPSNNNLFRRFFGDTIVHFRHWEFLEWALFVCLLILGMYAIGGISGNMVNLQAWEHVQAPDSAKMSPTQIQLLIAAQAVLLQAVIMGLLYLSLLRSLLGFLLALILLTLSAIIFIAIMIYLLRVIVTEKKLYEDMRSNIQERLEKMQRKFDLEAFQEKNKCCGVVDYRDWNIFKNVHMENSVPPSCCKKTVTGLKRLNCGLQVIQAEEKNIENTIYTKGCGKFMAAEYKNMFIRILVEDVLILILIIATIVILIILFILWYRKMHPKEVPTPNPREQENDAESDIIPGTPMKSYVSSSQKLYYAP